MSRKSFSTIIVGLLAGDAMYRRFCVFLAALLLGACAPTATPVASTLVANTPDVCGGATDPGARQRFTFEQITPCLNTVSKVIAFMGNNIKRDDGWDAKTCGGLCYPPAWLVYQNGVDDVHGLVTLECYFLEKNGWDAFHIGVAIETPIGTNVCGVNTKGVVLVLDENGKTEGSFNSLSEVARFYISHGRMRDGDKLRTIKASQITQLTTNQTTPSILGLPWEIHPY